MAYKQNQDGGFRARVSFPVQSVLVRDLNVICEATGHSMAHVCYTACRLLAERYVVDGEFQATPRPWPQPEAYEAHIETGHRAANPLHVMDGYAHQQAQQQEQPDAGT